MSILRKIMIYLLIYLSFEETSKNNVENQLKMSIMGL